MRCKGKCLQKRIRVYGKLTLGNIIPVDTLKLQRIGRLKIANRLRQRLEMFRAMEGMFSTLEQVRPNRVLSRKIKEFLAEKLCVDNDLALHWRMVEAFNEIGVKQSDWNGYRTWIFPADIERHLDTLLHENQNSQSDSGITIGPYSRRDVYPPLPPLPPTEKNE